MRAFASALRVSSVEAEQLLRAIGHEVKALLKEMALAGEIPAVPPLSPYTYFRKLQAAPLAADKFTIETGRYYETLRVQVVRGGKRKRGLAAVALLPRGKSERGLPHVVLLGIWNAGLVIRVTDPEKKRRMVAWLKKNLPELAPEVAEYFGYGGAGSDIEGRPIVITIPPRDPLPPMAQAKIHRAISARFAEYLSGRFQVLTGMLNREPWDQTSAERWRRRLISYARERLARALARYSRK